MSVFTAAAFFQSANLAALTCHLRPLISSSFEIVLSHVSLIWMSHYRDTDLTDFIYSDTSGTIFMCFFNPIFDTNLVIKAKENILYHGTVEIKNELKVIFFRIYQHFSSSCLSCHVCFSIFCCTTDSTWIYSLLFPVFLLFSRKCPINNMTA